uniref:Uncharacterized protein n=1 Tax=Triticum urartu TaxID=4572 RepID=A0A8R7PFU7_TRIUA
MTSSMSIDVVGTHHSMSVMGVRHGLHMERSLCHISDGLKPLYGSIQSCCSTISLKQDV